MTDDCHGGDAMVGRGVAVGLPFCLVGSSCLRQLERECEARIAIVSMHRSIDPGCSDGNGLSIIEAIHMIVEDRSVLIPLQFILLRI